MRQFSPGLGIAFRAAACALGAASLLVALGCHGPAAASNERGVILLRYAPGSESTEQREQGFLDTMKKDFPTIPLISTNQYAGATAEDALQKSQDLLQRFGTRADAIFAVNESAASGLMTALDQAGLLGKLTFIGFDPNPRMVTALKANKMQGIVLQDPVMMGYLAVKTIVAHLEGQAVEKRIGTGENLATPENAGDEKIAKLLSPEQFSGSDPHPGNAKYTIAIIPKGTTHEFWKSVHAGAARAANELGNVALYWKGPLNENDRDGQIDVVQDFVTKKVSGICLAPLDSQALVASVKEAKQQGIPTVIFDSGLNDPDAYVSYVATDNYHGGVLAAQRLGELYQAGAKK
ncbi:MAG TPA: substrate-binding domain-containing protein [Pirellulales bacterium]|nr:substrate-binding domain-containing protein [Pirellulales bacterium]